MMLPYLLFTDTETTGLAPSDEIWQIAWHLGDRSANYFIEHTKPAHPWVLKNTRYRSIFDCDPGSERAATERIVPLRTAMNALSADIAALDRIPWLVGNVATFDDEHLLRHFGQRPYRAQILDALAIVMGAYGLPCPPSNIIGARELVGLPARPVTHFAHDAFDDITETRDIVRAALQSAQRRGAADSPVVGPTARSRLCGRGFKRCF